MRALALAIALLLAPVILADRREAGPLTAEEGPWRLVISDDTRPDRGVRQVETIKVVIAP